MSGPLEKLLSDLHEERVRTWSQEDLDVNVNQRLENEQTFQYKPKYMAGGKMPNATLTGIDGNKFTLEEFASPGLAVMIFFRFSTCPACNVAIPYYDSELYPFLTNQGIPFLAISPQLPERIARIKERHDLRMDFASDSNNKLSEELGITYEFNAATVKFCEKVDLVMPNELGFDDWRLPHPSIFIVDRSLQILFAEVTPNWMARTEPELVINQIKKIQAGEMSSNPVAQAGS